MFPNVARQGSISWDHVRVSTDKQADHGVSLEAQSEKIRAMVTVHGAELENIIIEAGESAKNLNRPGMVRLLRMADARRVEVVIIAKLDRLTRSVVMWRLSRSPSRSIRVRPPAG